MGIRNGIDTEAWNPATDPHLEATYDVGDLSGKETDRARLRPNSAWPTCPGPLAVVVTRLADQKGVDLVVPLLPPARPPAGSGGGARRRRRTPGPVVEQRCRARPDRVAFVRGYDEALAHRLFVGGDLFLMPSRFEPCGLAQMQAMRYGTLPVVTDVGGLHDTVVDVDADPGRGTGVTAAQPTSIHLLDAWHRAARARSNRPRRDAMRRRGMTADWSWRAALAHIEHYQRIATR